MSRFRLCALVLATAATGLVALAGCSFSNRPSGNLPPCSSQSGFPCRAGALVELYDPATGQRYSVTPGQWDQLSSNRAAIEEICADPAAGVNC